MAGVIFVLYENNQSDSEEIVDIFKEEETKEEKSEKKEDKTDLKEKVFVDIKGMVAKPGMYEVDSSSRVSDVIELAGGLLEGADTNLINLSKIVEDEMVIIVYTSEEAREKYKEDLCSVSSGEPSNDALVTPNDTLSDTNENEKNETKLVNINTASENELTSLDGIGTAKAKAIVTYREKVGKFNSIEELKNVSGIGDALFEKVKAYITV